MGRLLLATFAIAMLLAPEAVAYQAVTSFRRPAIQGGGSGLYFTGSRRFGGLDCSACHLDAPGRMHLELESSPPELMSEGFYKPWETYAITLRMHGEHRGLSSPTNDNTFALEVVDDAGAPRGTFREVELGTLQRIDGEVEIDGVVFGATNRTTWSFEYTAPDPGSGRLAVHVAAVDGDGGASWPPPGPSRDPLGDDVFVHSWRLCEQWTECETGADERTSHRSPASLGCHAARHGMPARESLIAWLVTVCGVLWRRCSSKRSIRRGLALSRCQGGPDRRPP
jgi:hypothetical protein